VTFDIDANGIMNVSATDKATGKQQSIVIKASSGLSDEEIDRMVQDAEEHAAEDAKTRELIDAKNQAEQLIHATEKSMSDLAEQMEDGEKAEIESRLADVKEAVKGDDQQAIEAKVVALTEVTAKLAERAYNQQNTDDGAGEGDSGAGAEQSASADDAVDAEFEEVKDDKAS